MLSLMALQVLFSFGLAISPSYAHKAKVKTAQAQDDTVGHIQKLALVEGTVAVHEAPVLIEGSSDPKPPLSLKEVEKFNFDFGSGFSSGSI
jgi:hypothetical protein